MRCERGSKLQKRCGTNALDRKRDTCAPQGRRSHASQIRVSLLSSTVKNANLFRTGTEITERDQREAGCSVFYILSLVLWYSVTLNSIKSRRRICHNYPSMMDHVTDGIIHIYRKRCKARFAANRGNTKGDGRRLEFISLTYTSCSATSPRDMYFLSILTWDVKISLCNLQFYIPIRLLIFKSNLWRVCSRYTLVLWFNSWF